METIGSGIDDWFESSSNTSASQEPVSSTPKDLETVSTTFRRNLFQPVDDVIEDDPPIQPIVFAGSQEIKTQRLTTPRLSESGMFARSPDTKIARPPSARNSPLPTAKKHQTQPITESPTSSANNRKMSTWSVRENTFED